jgi:hypothetical protein
MKMKINHEIFLKLTVLRILLKIFITTNARQNNKKCHKCKKYFNIHEMFIKILTSIFTKNTKFSEKKYKTASII